MKDLMWKTREGKEIPVKDMATSHIKNSLAMLKRQGAISPETRAFYLTTSGPQGEMAQMCFEQEFDEVMKAPVSIFIVWIIAILIRGGAS